MVSLSNEKKRSIISWKTTERAVILTAKKHLRKAVKS